MISLLKLDEIIDFMFNKEVYIFVDFDDLGNKLRK